MIESILALFAIGTVWFWILTFVISCIIIGCIEHDHYKLPSTIAVLAAIFYYKTIAALPWQHIAIGIGIYAAVGVFWSIFRWFRYVSKKALEFRERYGTELSDSSMRELKSDISVSHNKSRLTGWIAYWPWSLFWNVLGDFFNMLYETMTKAYQKITDNALKDFTPAPIPSPGDEMPRNKRHVITDADPSWPGR